MKPSIENTSRRIMWVLPDREQNGEDHVLSNGRQCLLSEALNVTQLPKSLVLGIPEEVVEKKADDEGLIFAQFIRQPKLNRSLYALSVRCGRDRTGRIVFLTRLELLLSNELPIADVPAEPLLALDEAAMVARLGLRLLDETDEWVNGLYRMLQATIDNPELSSFANVKLHRTHYKPDWMPKKKTPEPPH